MCRFLINETNGGVRCFASRYEVVRRSAELLMGFPHHRSTRKLTAIRRRAERTSVQASDERIDSESITAAAFSFSRRLIESPPHPLPNSHRASAKLNGEAEMKTKTPRRCSTTQHNTVRVAGKKETLQTYLLEM